MIKTTDTIVAIGSSTGGTEAVKEVLEVLPPNSPPILIAQHMPERFTKNLGGSDEQPVPDFRERSRRRRQRAARSCADCTGQLPRDPRTKRGARHLVRLNQDTPVNRHRPSVDVMFASVAKHAGVEQHRHHFDRDGDDGAAGLLQMKQSGAYTIAAKRIDLHRVRHAEGSDSGRGRRCGSCRLETFPTRSCVNCAREAGEPCDGHAA